MKLASNKPYRPLHHPYPKQEKIIPYKKKYAIEMTKTKQRLLNSLPAGSVFIIVLVWLTPDDFTRQGRHPAGKGLNELYFILLPRTKPILAPTLY